MDKIENIANKYVERHIRDRHLSDDTIKEIKIAYIREDNPIPEMLPNAGTNPDNIITTVLGIDNDGGDW